MAQAEMVTILPSLALVRHEPLPPGIINAAARLLLAARWARG